MDEQTVEYPKIYALDASGSVRIWFATRKGDQICNTSGLEDGKLVTSKWKKMTAKNVGRSNYVSAEDQADVEIKALYAKQLKKHGYWENREDIHQVKFIEPMLAHKFVDFEDRLPGIVFAQPKLDGFRCILNAEEGTSKHGEKFATVDHIIKQVEQLVMHPAIKAFDGELYNHELREDFNKIASLITKKKPSLQHLNSVYDLIQYHVYDFVPNDEYKHLTQSERLDILRGVLFQDTSNIKLVPTEPIEKVDVESERVKWTEQGYEGLMVRDPRALYEVGRRTETLLKHKVRIDEEFKVLDILEGKGNGAGLAKKAVFEKDGVQFRAGINGNNQFTADLLKNKDQYIGGDATVQYFSLTPGKKVPRFGKVVLFHGGPRKF